MSRIYDYVVQIDLPQAKGSDQLPCVCGSCGWKGTVDDVTEIDSCSLTPGDPSPMGRCPSTEDGDACGSLVYLNREYDRAVLKVDELVEKLRQVLPVLDSGERDDVAALLASINVDSRAPS